MKRTLANTLARRDLKDRDRVYIVFDNRADEATGLVELARRTRVDALPEGVYALCRSELGGWIRSV
jgi:hypothetical protein